LVVGKVVTVPVQVTSEPTVAGELTEVDTNTESRALVSAADKAIVAVRNSSGMTREGLPE
jgi:hypothetical protein